MMNHEINSNLVMTVLTASLIVCNQAVRWITRQNINVQLSHQQRSKVIYFQLKKLYKDESPIALALLAQLEAANQVKSELKESNTHVDPVIAKARKKEKLNWLQNHKNLLVDLRQKGHSYRVISEHIKYRFRMEVSHTYIAQALENWEV